MFPGGLPRCFEFILGSDDFSRPFGESAQGDERRPTYILRPRPIGQLKPVPQEVDVTNWVFDPDLLRARIDGMSQPEQDAYRMGARKAVSDVMVGLCPPRGEGSRGDPKGPIKSA